MQKRKSAAAAAVLMSFLCVTAYADHNTLGTYHWGQIRQTTMNLKIGSEENSNTCLILSGTNHGAVFRSRIG